MSESETDISTSYANGLVDIDTNDTIIVDHEKGQEFVLSEDEEIFTISSKHREFGSMSRDQSHFEIAYTGKELNPWSMPFVGIPINYFCVGLIHTGARNILYPFLIINQGLSSSFYIAASELVSIFWSYNIIFGTLIDCFPIMGYHKKPYIVLGWVLCAAILVVLAITGENISSINLVIMLTAANFGYVLASAAADGVMVWMAHREPLGKRGGVQSLIYIMREIGRLTINIMLLVGFSGPNISCAGYEPDPNIACTQDTTISNRNELFVVDPVDWCHQQCAAATFSFEL